MEEYPNAFKHIINLVHNLCEDMIIEQRSGHRLKMVSQGKNLEVSLDSDELDDLEVALDNNLNTGYFFTLENQIM
jgi:hypothetical protein